MNEIERTIQRLLEANALREPLLWSAIGALGLPAGSHGLDAGCGIGLQAMLLAETVGPDGHISGIDIAPGLLACGQALVEVADFAGRISFYEGDVAALPFAGDTFDWAWSADCLGYPAGELVWLLAELRRVVKPGGRIILLGWSSQALLPGHPLLEARLNATCSAYLPFLRGRPPELHFLRALRWFREAGLVEARAHTLAGTIQAPLAAEERAGLISLFDMLWGERQAGVTAEDWSAYRRLCLPESVDFILDIPDYVAFFTYSLFEGRVAEKVP